METSGDSFSIESNSPLDEESWKVLTDTELDSTEHICFTTAGGKQVDFIKADARLDKIRAEINGMYRVILKGTPKDDWAVRWNDCLDEVLQVIDKYRESEDING